MDLITLYITVVRRGQCLIMDSGVGGGGMNVLQQNPVRFFFFLKPWKEQENLCVYSLCVISHGRDLQKTRVPHLHLRISEFMVGL